MSILFTCKLNIAGNIEAARQTFDVFRETEISRDDDDLILWNLRPTEEPFTYLIDVEADRADDEEQARAQFAEMLAKTKPANRGIAFSELTRVEGTPESAPGP